MAGTNGAERLLSREEASSLQETLAILTRVIPVAEETFVQNPEQCRVEYIQHVRLGILLQQAKEIITKWAKLAPSVTEAQVIAGLMNEILTEVVNQRVTSETIAKVALIKVDKIPQLEQAVKGNGKVALGGEVNLVAYALQLFKDTYMDIR